jgi:hypothetical protein
VWYVDIPEYDAAIALHGQLAALGERAEMVAADVDLDTGIGFQVARRRVRQALETDGVAQAIEGAVAGLLPKP